jgi:hypothetical protein
VFVYIMRKESRMYLRACTDGKKYCGEKKVRLEKRGRSTSKSCEEIKSSRLAVTIKYKKLFCSIKKIVNFFGR